MLSDQWICLLFCLLANFACTQAFKLIRAVTLSCFLISTSFSLGTQSDTARETQMGTFNYSLTSLCSPSPERHCSLLLTTDSLQWLRAEQAHSAARESTLAALFCISDVLQWPQGSAAGALGAGNNSIIHSSLSLRVKDAEDNIRYPASSLNFSCVLWISPASLISLYSSFQQVFSLLTLFYQLTKRTCGKCPRGQVLLKSAVVTGTYCLSR